MTDIFLWTYAFLATAVAAATVWRVIKIVHACRTGMKTPPSAPRPSARERLGVDMGVFFSKALAAVLHTVLVVSFLSMAFDAVATIFRLLFFQDSVPENRSVFSVVNAVLAAATIAAAGVLLLRRTVGRLPRYATLTPAQRRDGYTVLLLEIASAATLLAVYAASGASEGLFGRRDALSFALCLHYGVLLIFGLYITYSKHLHIFLAPAYLAIFGRRETFAPDDLPEAAEALDILQGAVSATASVPERLGAAEASDLTRGRLLSVFSCTQCGRCDSVCPVARSDARFSPRQVLFQVRRCALRPEKGPLYDRAISREQAFACIACGACLEACPVAISPMDVLLQIRRYATLERGDAPPEYARAASAIDATGDPWGFGRNVSSAADRDEPPFPVADPACPPRYLLWRGPMGIHDPQGRRAVRSLSRLLTAAGVSWAVLPEGQECDTADILRYTGDEWTFLSAARRNIETLSHYGVKNIVTPCPHSWSVLKNQYPSLGGRYRVWHASEFVLRLVEEGKIALRPTLKGQKAVYHDPCRLSRSHLTRAPRVLLRMSGAELLEAPQYGTRSMCCGGGDYFRADGSPDAIADRRVEQLLSCGVDQVITACPFCRQMLSRTGMQVPVTDLLQWLEL